MECMICGKPIEPNDLFAIHCKECSNSIARACIDGNPPDGINTYITGNSTGSDSYFLQEGDLNFKPLEGFEEISKQIQFHTLDEIYVTQSTHKGFLEYAKKHLLEKVIMSSFPTIVDKEIIILLSGAALNKQVDKNLLIYPTDCDINEKLDKLDLGEATPVERKMKQDFKVLNRYYNSTKHENQDYHTEYEDNLCTTEGRFITIHFFECVRRIFVWYYEQYSKQGVPDWDVLKEINYADYCIKYDFMTYRLK